MPAGADLIGDVAHLERMGVHALLGDEGADAGDAHQHAFRGEFLQRPVRGHARHRERAHQLVLRGHPLARAQRAGGDALEHVVLHLAVARGSLGQGHGGLRTLEGAGCGPPCWHGRFSLSIQV